MRQAYDENIGRDDKLVRRSFLNGRIIAKNTISQLIMRHIYKFYKRWGYGQTLLSFSYDNLLNTNGYKKLLKQNKSQYETNSNLICFKTRHQNHFFLPYHWKFTEFDTYVYGLIKMWSINFSYSRNFDYWYTTRHWILSRSCDCTVKIAKRLYFWSTR